MAPALGFEALPAQAHRRGGARTMRDEPAATL